MYLFQNLCINCSLHTLSSSPSHSLAWVTPIQSSGLRLEVTSSRKPSLILPHPPPQPSWATLSCLMYSLIYPKLLIFESQLVHPLHSIIIPSPFSPGTKQNIWPLVGAQIVCKIKFNSEGKPILFSFLPAATQESHMTFCWSKIDNQWEGAEWDTALDRPQFENNLGVTKHRNIFSLFSFQTLQVVPEFSLRVSLEAGVVASIFCVSWSLVFVLKRREQLAALYLQGFPMVHAVPRGVKVGEVLSARKKAHWEAPDLILFTSVQIHRLGLDICQSAAKQMVAKWCPTYSDLHQSGLML